MENLCGPRQNVDEGYCEQLVRQGADLGFNEDRTLSPLLLAARFGLWCVVDAILERGADANEKDRNGWTALMFAAQRGFADIVELLIEKGADIHAVSKKGETSFGLAQEKGNTGTQEVLIRTERARQQAETEAFAEEFQNEVARAHIVQAPIAVGHALRLVKRGM
jgi:ankyrin repeat protein